MLINKIMRQILSIGIASSLFIIIFYTSSCNKKEITKYDCTGITPTYTSNVKSILDANCAFSGCHNASSKADGIDLSSYSSAKSQSSNDKFLGSIQHISGYDDMPQNASKLDDATIKTLSCWVQNGSPE